MNTKITPDDLTNWFKKQIAFETGLKESEINLDVDIQTYNMDSLSLVSIAHDLETYIGIPVDPTIFDEFKTINEIVKWIQKM